MKLFFFIFAVVFSGLAQIGTAGLAGGYTNHFSAWYWLIWAPMFVVHGISFQVGRNSLLKWYSRQ